MKKNYFQVFLVLFILIVFPAVSYWYLKEGFSYRKATLGELGSFQKLPSMRVSANDGGVLNLDSLGNVVFFAAFVHKAEEQHRDKLATLFNQYKDRADYVFLLVDENPSVESFVSQASGARFYHLVSNATTIDSIYGLFDAKGKPSAMVLADTKGVIRNYYTGFEEDVFRHIVKQTTVLFPLAKNAKPLLTRDSEK